MSWQHYWKQWNFVCVCVCVCGCDIFPQSHKDTFYPSKLVIMRIYICKWSKRLIQKVHKAFSCFLIAKSVLGFGAIIFQSSCFVIRAPFLTCNRTPNKGQGNKHFFMFFLSSLHIIQHTQFYLSKTTSQHHKT